MDEKLGPAPAAEEAGRIGFIGLGTIGKPLAENMVAAGLRPVLFDIDGAALEAVASKGGIAAASCADLAGRVDAVGICVPADKHVRVVLDGPEGLFENLTPGSVVAIHSTIASETIHWAAEAGRKKGVRVVEACLTGGPRGAKAGETTFILGGDPEDFAPLEPLFSACGKVRVFAGPLGSASRLKLCLNLQTYVTQAGIAEAIGLARSLDVPLSGLKEAMKANGQLGDLSESFFTLHELPREVIEEPSVLAFRSAQQLIVAKDMDLLRMAGEQAGADVGLLEEARSHFERTYLLPLPDTGGQP